MQRRSDHKVLAATLCCAVLSASCAPTEEETRARAVTTSMRQGSAPLPGRVAPQHRTGARETATATASWQAATAKSVTPAADKVAKLAAEIAAELAARCPLGDAADQAALEACKKAMYGGSK